MINNLIILARKRFETVRRREKNGVNAEKRKSPYLKVLNSFCIAVIWLAALSLIGQGNFANSVEEYIASGGTLIVLGICGQQLLKVIAPDSASMHSYWPLMLVMFLIAATEVWINDYAFSKLIVPCLSASTSEAVKLLAYPNAIVPFLVSMLYGGPVALVIGLVTSATVAMGRDFNLGIFLIALCSTCIIAREAPGVSRRNQMPGIVLRSAAIQLIVVAIMLYRMNYVDFHGKLILGGVFYLSFFLSVFAFALVILPVAEMCTKRIGNISIRRYADLELPLLRRLSLEAPGTYHHVMMVGDLAQAAADAIGANGTLARVGAYYHDIGKLGHPHYYMENQSGITNPNDELPPNISRIIIMNHVKEGLVLAKIHHLPRVFHGFILKHHGTSIARWFFIKEQERLAKIDPKREKNINPEEYFRYPGPLPETREETIVSLADSIEAASRSMRFFDRNKIESLVNGIIKERWTDGQLDKSQLTNAELAIVKNSFIATLVHLLHGRLPYPSQK